MILLPQLTRQAQLYRALGGKDTVFLLIAAWVPPGGKVPRGDRFFRQSKNPKPCRPTLPRPFQGRKRTGEMLRWIQLVASAQVPGPKWLNKEPFAASRPLTSTYSPRCECHVRSFSSSPPPPHTHSVNKCNDGFNKILNAVLFSGAVRKAYLVKEISKGGASCGE